MGSYGPSDPKPSSWHPFPAYHLKAPRGWINDPCAPGYDEATGTYHLFYQCKKGNLFRDSVPTLTNAGNPNSCDWGDICWGHFTSRDGIHWEHNGTKPALRPDQPYDSEGVFTGCFFPGGPKGEKDGQLTVVYSSITALPIHWTIPYTRNCAGLALATSKDGGRTWRKSDLNPILDGEPEGLVVTGYRDPFLVDWPAMDDARGTDANGKRMYGIVSGGIVDKGPNAFVYEVSPHDLTTWSYLGPLVDVPIGYQRPSHWTGDFGVNWECVNSMTLKDQTSTQETQMLLMGTEGGYKKHAKPDDEDPHGVWSLWMGGSLRKTDSGVRLEPEFTGFLDNGCFYAANSYEHPVTGQRIVWGWIKEEELTLARRESKGWTGYLSLQREIFLFSANNVVGTIGTPLKDIPSFKVLGQTVQTLGIRPLPELQNLRQSKPVQWTSISDDEMVTGRLISTKSSNWEMQATIHVRPDVHQRIGFHIRLDDGQSQQTSLYFSPGKEEIVVDRSISNREEDIQKDSQSGPFTLLVSEGADGQQEIETLRLHVFSDGDVLEVFANDRFALSTVVYADSRCNGISWFVDSEGPVTGGEAVFESISIWEDLASIQRGSQ